MGTFHQDLDFLTRDMHDKSWRIEYMEKNPITALLLERKDLRFNGGERYYKNVDTDTQEDLAQDYGVNDILTHGVEDTTEQIFFRRKLIQFPVQIDVEEKLENAMQSENRTQLQDLAKFRVRKAQEGMRVHLRKKIYMGVGAGYATSPSDTNKFMQGLNSALEVDETYGTQTRTFSAGTKADTGFWWQPMGGTVSTGTQQAETAISINLMRTLLEPLDDLESDNVDLVSIMGGVLWLSLQAEAEAKNKPYTLVDQRVAKQGFTEMILDDRRIIKDPFLQASRNAEMGETANTAGAMDRRWYSINLKDWDFYIHPTRNFKMTTFFDQSQLMGGTDSNLARIFFAGNLVCWGPNANLYKSNMLP